MRLNYSKELEIKYDVDVLVVGGGPAGVAAAVSAADEGASVFLAEEYGAFGGSGPCLYAVWRRRKLSDRKNCKKSTGIHKKQFS